MKQNIIFSVSITQVFLHVFCYQFCSSYYYTLNPIVWWYPYGVPFQKKLISFLSTEYFFCATLSCFFQHEILFCATSTFFCWHGTLIRAVSICFCLHQITFCATSNFLFRHKIVFCVTPNFYFGHCLECYVMVICFSCHVASKI